MKVPFKEIPGSLFRIEGNVPPATETKAVWRSTKIGLWPNKGCHA